MERTITWPKGARVRIARPIEIAEHYLSQR